MKRTWNEIYDCLNLLENSIKKACYLFYNLAYKFLKFYMQKINELNKGSTVPKLKKLETEEIKIYVFLNIVF